MPHFKSSPNYLVPIKTLYSRKPFALYRAGGLGDVIMSLPTIKQLSAQTLHPVHIICNKSYHPLLKFFPFISGTHDSPKDKDEMFSAIIDLNHIGDFDSASRRVPRWELYASFLDLEISIESFSLAIPKIHYLSPFIGISLSSAILYRTWPYAMKLAKMLSKNHQVAIIDSKKQKISSDLLNLTGLPLDELVKALVSCVLMITPDSGMMHIAQLMDIPTIALFGATEPKFRIWKPNLVHPVQNTQLACVPCFELNRHDCRKTPQFRQCMKSIKPEIILKIIKNNYQLKT